MTLPGDKVVLVPNSNTKQYVPVQPSSILSGDKVVLLPTGNENEYVPVSTGSPIAGDKVILVPISNTGEYIPVLPSAARGPGNCVTGCNAWSDPWGKIWYRAGFWAAENLWTKYPDGIGDCYFKAVDTPCENYLPCSHFMYYRYYVTDETAFSVDWKGDTVFSAVSEGVSYRVVPAWLFAIDKLCDKR